MESFSDRSTIQRINSKFMIADFFVIVFLEGEPFFRSRASCNTLQVYFQSSSVFSFFHISTILANFPIHIFFKKALQQHAAATTWVMKT